MTDYQAIPADEATRVYICYLDNLGRAAIFQEEGWETQVEEAAGDAPLFLVQAGQAIPTNYYSFRRDVTISVWSSDAKDANDIATRLSKDLETHGLINAGGWIHKSELTRGPERLNAPNDRVEGVALTLTAEYR